jgi:hypothetical protein
MRALREACSTVSERAEQVQINHAAIPAYAASLVSAAAQSKEPEQPSRAGSQPDREALAAFWLTLDAINFGSGWFPTLRKRDGMSGYNTIAAGLCDRFETASPWSAAELSELTAASLAPVLHQDPDHELIALFAASLNDLGARVATDHQGSFAVLAGSTQESAAELATMLGSYDCFADCSRYDELEVPFLKRAQIAAADLHRAGVIHAPDLAELTMFADNLVPHVLRLDGVLRFDQRLTQRIDREELIQHDSKEEIEIRACAVHAVELIVAAPDGPSLTAAETDQLLWDRGQQPRYKASPRHRARCTAY